MHCDKCMHEIIGFCFSLSTFLFFVFVFVLFYVKRGGVAM